MKTLVLTLVSLVSITASAQAQSELYVKVVGTEVGVQTLLDDGTDIQSVYGFENFCYRGNAETVLNKITQYKRGGEFFSGGGGGFEYLKGTVLRGFVTYDLELTFLDEVAEGETKIITVKPCGALDI